MQKPQQVVSKMAVELFYNNVHELAHPDAGQIKLVYFGHTSDGQKKITRQVSEALVMLLERNGLHVVNGLSEARALLESNDYVVLAPDELPFSAPTTYEAAAAALGDPTGTLPGEPKGEPKAIEDTRQAIANLMKGNANV